MSETERIIGLQGVMNLWHKKLMDEMMDNKSFFDLPKKKLTEEEREEQNAYWRSINEYEKRFNRLKEMFLKQVPDKYREDVEESINECSCDDY